MKRLLFYFFAAVMTLTVTSCEDDDIARTLDGIWEGDMIENITMPPTGLLSIGI